MADMSVFELNELIICEIQKRTVLWDKKNKKFKDRYVVAQAWREVSKITGTSEDEVKKRWRNLRDQFKKELKKVKKPKSGSSQGSLEKYYGKWSYYTLMLFLKDVETPRNTSGTFSDDYDLELGQSDVDKSSDQEHDSFDIENSPSKQSVTQDNQTSSQSVNKSFSITEQTVTKSNDQKKKKKRENDSNFEQQMLDLEKAKIEAFVNSTQKDHTKDDEDMHFLKSIHPYFTAMTPIQKLRVRNQIQEFLIREMLPRETPLSQSNQPTQNFHLLQPSDQSSQQPTQTFHLLQPSDQSSQQPNAY